MGLHFTLILIATLPNMTGIIIILSLQLFETHLPLHSTMSRQRSVHFTQYQLISSYCISTITFLIY